MRTDSPNKMSLIFGKRDEEDIAKHVADPPNIFSLVPNSDVIES